MALLTLASALGLLDLGDKSVSYAALIQNVNRWLLSTFSVEHIDLRPSVDDALGIPTTTTITCQQCGFTSSRGSTLHAVDMTYPRKSGTFCDILRSSLIRESSTRASCSNCKQFAQLQTRRTLSSSLPQVLSLNAMVSSSETLELWQEGFLQPSVYMSVLPGGDISVTTDGEADIYDVTVSPALVLAHSSLSSFKSIPTRPTSCALPKVSHSVTLLTPVSSEWLVFNDFLVQPVPEVEVFRFESWKTPAVVFLQRRDLSVDLSVLPTRLGSSALLQDISIAWNRRKNMIKHKVLTPDEIPIHGSLVSIDAEFVALQQVSSGMSPLTFRKRWSSAQMAPKTSSVPRTCPSRGCLCFAGKASKRAYHSSTTISTRARRW